MIFGISISLAGFAQNRPEAREETNSKLEEVTVTARFREERIQEIGASIAAYDENLITREGLLVVQDIALRTASMEVLSLGPNINDINIRGISNALPTGRGLKALAATFVDDVVVSGLGSGAATDFNTFDLARIEVLRGPQPTHFGEGSGNGEVNYKLENDFGLSFWRSVAAGSSATMERDAIGRFGRSSRTTVRSWSSP